MKKPESEVEESQRPAQGGQVDESHATSAQAEAAAHGDTPKMVSGPNGNQGGN